MKRWMNLMALALPLAAFAQNPVQIKLVNWATGITDPVDLGQCGDSRLFVVEQGGKIKIITDSMTVATRPFLDITSEVNSNGNEQGLLGLAFDPDYSTNGLFYVYYINGAGSGTSRISRFSVSSDPDSADIASEHIIYSWPQPYTNHNGGDLDFGPDGYLYCGFGDGGNGGDPQGHAQNPHDPLGNMIRIKPEIDSTYSIPPTNPYANANPADTLPEIWATGLRNPYRFGFDRLTGDLWIGDVGQNAWEEVDFWPAGDNSGPNFGWRCYEGLVAYNTANCQQQSYYVDPIFVKENIGIGGSWCSSIGGRVYRGTWWPHLYGHYFHTDYCGGEFYSEYPDGNGGWISQLALSSANSTPTGIMEDAVGELYVVSRDNGTVKKIQDKCPMDAPVVTQNDDTLTSTTANGYQWYYNGSPISGAINQTYITVQTGSYYVVGSFSGGCALMSDSVSFINTGVPALIAPTVRLAPNPANDRMDITLTGVDLTGIVLMVNDAEGRNVLNATLQARANMSLDVSGLAPGAYALRAINTQGVTLTTSRFSIVR